MSDAVSDLQAPKFAHFRLVRCSVDSSLGGAGRELALKFEPGIELELQEREEPDQLRALVIIRCKGIAFKEDESKPEATVDADYAAEFRYPDGVRMEQLQDTFETHEYQRQLVVQVYPMAVLKFRDLLADMGLMAAAIPLSPP